MFLGFSIRLILITYGHFCCCYIVLILSQGLFSVSHEEGVSAHEEGHKKLVRAQPGQLSKLTKGIFHTREPNAQKESKVWHLSVGGEQPPPRPRPRPHPRPPPPP